MKEEFRIECDCGEIGHFVSFRPWADRNDTLWCYVVEANRDMSFSHRLKWGIRYIIGNTDLNHYEILFGPKELKRLHRFIQRKLEDRKDK